MPSLVTVSSMPSLVWPSTSSTRTGGGDDIAQLRDFLVQTYGVEYIYAAGFAVDSSYSLG